MKRYKIAFLLILIGTCTVVPMLIVFFAPSPIDQRVFRNIVLQSKISIGSNNHSNVENKQSSLQVDEYIYSLFDYTHRLNTSKLNACHIHERIVTFSETTDANKYHTYNLLTPQWQARPRRTPYFVSAILRLRLYKEDKAKWTMAELKQWIHYQLWAGAEHIYICNHYLSREERIVDDLAKYSQAGVVTAIDWVHIEAVPGSPNYDNNNTRNQIGCYNHVLEKWGHLSVWMYTLDMDENPYCPQDRCEGFLTRYLQNPTSDTEQLAGVLLLENFILQGQGDRSRHLYYERINRITPQPANGLVKPIFRTNWTRDVVMHGVTLLKGMTIRVAPSRMKMLHYWGARTQNWGPDTEEMLRSTVEFNDVRESIAIVIHHSLLAFGEFDGFSHATGP